MPPRRIPLPLQNQTSQNHPQQQKINSYIEKKIEEDLKNPEKVIQIKQKLKESFDRKHSETLEFFQKIHLSFESISSTSPSSSQSDESDHCEIVFQNLRKMIHEGEKVLLTKKEITPFKTLILQFDQEEEGFQKIHRRTPICSDNQTRYSAYEYIQFILSNQQSQLQEILENESPLFSFKLQEKHHPMLTHQLNQINDEYPEYYTTMSFFQQKDFLPINQFIIFATLKI